MSVLRLRVYQERAAHNSGTLPCVSFGEHIAARFRDAGEHVVDFREIWRYMDTRSDLSYELWCGPLSFSARAGAEFQTSILRAA